jgi:hypothetical protein
MCATRLLHRQRKARANLDAAAASNSLLSGVVASEAHEAAAREAEVRRNAATSQAQYDAFLYAHERGKGEHAVASAEVAVLERRSLRAREALGGIFAAQESAARLAARARALRSQLAVATSSHNKLLMRGARATEELVALRATRERQARDRAGLGRRGAAAAAAQATHLAAAERALRAHDGAVLAATQAQAEAQRSRAALEGELEREESGAAACVGAAAREPLAPYIGELSPQEEAAIAKRVADALEEEAGLREQGAALTAALLAAEEGMTRLAAETGLRSVEEALTVWSENEASNFALYNALIAQTRELQRLEGEVAALLREGAPHGPRLWEALRQLRGGGGAPSPPHAAHHHPLLRDGTPAALAMSAVVQLATGAVDAREAVAARAAADAAAATAAADTAEAALRAASGGLEALLHCCGGEVHRGGWALAPAGRGGAPALSRSALLETLAIVELRTGALLGAYATLVEAAEREKGAAAGGRALRILGVRPLAPAPAHAAGVGGAPPRPRSGMAPLALPSALAGAGEDADEGGRSGKRGGK